MEAEILPVRSVEADLVVTLAVLLNETRAQGKADIPAAGACHYEVQGRLNGTSIECVSVSAQRSLWSQ